MKRFLTIVYWVAFVVCPLFAQTGFVAGRLADGDGNPVAYANIVLKTATGDSLIGSATTGEDGSFSIPAAPGTSGNGRTGPAHAGEPGMRRCARKRPGKEHHHEQ